MHDQWVMNTDSDSSQGTAFHDSERHVQTKVSLSSFT